MRKLQNDFISTREAAKMLKVSLSTVMRYHDKGIIKGEKTPISHRRHVNRESVVLLMKKYGMEVVE